VLTEATPVVGGAGRAIGVDLTPAMLARVEARLMRPKIAVMDAHSLGIVSGVFDAVACNFALTCFPDPQRALDECRRVLLPHGRLGLVVHDGWWWHDDSRWAWHAQLLAEFGNSRATAPRRFGDPDAVLTIVEQAGFTNAVAKVEPFDLGWPDASHWWDWCWSYGYRVVLEEFDTATLGDFRNECFSHLGAGPIEGTLPVICAVADKPA
jgi:ubiquinone/menaquinone biosynthesis C-methylase UbiE